MEDNIPTQFQTKAKKNTEYLKRLTSSWGEKPAPYKASTWGNVGVAATPMLIGLLMGDVGTGAEHAASGLKAMQDRENKISDSLASYQMKMGLANKKVLGGISKKNSDTNIYGEKIYLTSLDKSPSGYVYADRTPVPKNRTKLYSVGDVELLKKREAAKFKTIKDPITNETFIGTPDNLKKVDTSSTNYPKGWVKPQEDFTKKSSASYSKYIMDNTKDISRLNKIYSSLNEKNIYAQTLAIGAIIKEIETRPTDEDVKRYTRPLSIAAKTIAALRAKIGNKYPKKLVSAMRNLVKNQLLLINGNRESYKKGLTSQASGLKIDTNYFSSRLGFKQEKSGTDKKDSMVTLTDGKHFFEATKEEAISKLKEFKELRYAK